MTDHSSHSDLNPFVYKLYAAIGKALSHPVRLMLLDWLMQGTYTVEELTAALEQPLATVSQHLQILKHAGLVSAEKRGTHRYYQLTHPTVRQLMATLRQTSHACQAEIELMFRKQAPDAPRLELADWVEQVKAGELSVLDIRSLDEYQQGHIPSALSAPYEHLLERVKVLKLPKKRPVTAYCRTSHCMGIQRTLELLADQGYQVRYAEVGYSDWPEG